MENITLYGKKNTYTFCPFDRRNVLGEGGMGRVFKGVADNGRQVAIKAIFAELVKKPSVRERGELEAHLQFQHPHLIQMLDCCVSEEGRVHIISGFVDGVVFSDYIKTAGTQPNAKKKTINHMESILDALHFLHQNGIVHRDVKPDNIMITKEEKAVLMDLGVARASNGKRLTNAGVIIGTPHYSAPEQIRGEGNMINPTTDVYAAGITLYELLTGIPPFDGSSQYDIMEMQIKKPIPPNALLPAETYKVLRKATEKQQAGRYQTALQFKDALNSVSSSKNWWSRLFS